MEGYQAPEDEKRAYSIALQPRTTVTSTVTLVDVRPRSNCWHARGWGEIGGGFRRQKLGDGNGCGGFSKFFSPVQAPTVPSYSSTKHKRRVDRQTYLPHELLGGEALLCDQRYR